jgi:exodeoxyribonuclease VII large subunit
MKDLSVSEFLYYLNNNLENTFPLVSIVGELANFRISQNKWIYFDLKDEVSHLRFFGLAFKLKQPISDGMLLKVSCYPRMHQKYGFSMQVVNAQPFGEGSLKKSLEILHAKLADEGLFAVERKRALPYPPSRIGLITSSQSAAYSDFIKIVNNRWSGLEIILSDVVVQGNLAVDQLIQSVKKLEVEKGIEVIVMIRGGGDPEDLAVFNDENLTRKIAQSKVPVMVAVGHEIDICLAELAADVRASTPSNAAEILVPEKAKYLLELEQKEAILNYTSDQLILVQTEKINNKLKSLNQYWLDKFRRIQTKIDYYQNVLNALNPEAVLKRGYSITRYKGKIVKNSKILKSRDKIDVQFYDGNIRAEVK